MANRIIENKPGKRAKTNDENVEKKETVKKSTPGKNKKKEKKPLTKNQKIVLGVVAGILGIILILAIIFVVKLAKNDWDFGQTLTNDVLGPKDPIFVLAMGVSEDIEVPLTDTMMVLGYNPTDQKAFAISIPRDTFIGNDYYNAGGYDKLNSLYQKSPEKTKQAIEKILGIDIDHYVVVQNKVVRDVVDALGAVEFNVPIDMDYDDDTQNLHIHLKAGVQSMNGEQVEQLLRFRHNNDGSSYPSSYGDNDYGRMKTQREFIKVVAQHLIKVNNVGKLKAIAEAVFANLETNMSIGDMIGYIPYAIAFNVDDLRMEQLPGSGAMLNKLSFYKASHTRSKALMNELIEYLALDDAEKKKYYTGKIKQTIAATAEEETCEHNYTSEITKESTCEDTGIRKYTCTKCKGTYEEIIATTSHEYDSNDVCKVCGVEKETEEHTCEFSKFIHEELPATCINNGEATYRCKYCKETLNKTIPATGIHTYGSDGKCTTTGCTAKKETSGNTTKPEESTPTPQPPATCTHTNTTETKTEPTCVKTGSIVKKCKDCGENISTETLPKTNVHNFKDTTKATCGNAGCTEPNPNYVAPSEPPVLDQVTPPSTDPTTSVDPGVGTPEDAQQPAA